MGKDARSRIGSVSKMDKIFTYGSFNLKTKLSLFKSVVVLTASYVGETLLYPNDSVGEVIDTPK